MTDFAHFPRPGENDPYIYAIAPQGEWVQPDVRLDVKEAYMMGSDPRLQNSCGTCTTYVYTCTTRTTMNYMDAAGKRKVEDTCNTAPLQMSIRVLGG